MANPFFHAEYYLATNTDVAEAVNGDKAIAEQHYFLHGAGEGRNPAPWFDADYYRSSNPDLADVSADELFLHFTLHGVFEGRTPAEGLEFDAAAYLAANQDLIEGLGIVDAENLTADEAGLLAQHFYAHGYKEDREGGPDVPEWEDTEPSTLTEALAALSAAQEARVDFLKETYENNEDIADIVGTTFGAEATATAIGTAHDNAIANGNGDGVNDLIAASGSGIGQVDKTRSDTYNQAIIDEQTSVLAKKVADAQKTVNETEGLNAAVQALATAQEGLGEAIDAQADTGADQAGAVSAFQTANTGVTLAIQYGSVTAGAYSAGTVDLADLDLATALDLVLDGANPVVQMTTKGAIVLTADYKDDAKAAELLAAVQANVAAIQGLIAATSDLNGAIAEVLALELEGFESDGTAVTSGDDGATPVIISTPTLFTNEDGEVFVGDGATPTNIYLVTEVEAVVGATGAITSVAVRFNSDTAATPFVAANHTVVDGTNTLAIDASDVNASAAFINAGSEATGYLTANFDTVAADSAALISAQRNESAFEEAVERYVETKALKDELGNNDADVKSARDYLTDEDEGLGITLLENAQNFTVNDDVYLFTENGSANVSLAKFGASGEDKIFFGEGFTLVALGEQNINTESVGDANTLEIFWEQVGSNVNLYVETEAFGGNSKGMADVVQLTLTGVTGADIADDLGAGFLSLGTAA